MKVCVACRVEMRPSENGVMVVEMASFGPYKMYEADMWQCPSCGWRGILGFAQEPFAEHFQPEFAGQLANAEAERTVVRFWANPREKNSPNVEAS